MSAAEWWLSAGEWRPLSAVVSLAAGDGSPGSVGCQMLLFCCAWRAAEQQIQLSAVLLQSNCTGGLEC
jgi:hypothetical protein